MGMGRPQMPLFRSGHRDPLNGVSDNRRRINGASIIAICDDISGDNDIWEDIGWGSEIEAHIVVVSRRARRRRCEAKS